MERTNIPIKNNASNKSPKRDYKENESIKIPNDILLKYDISAKAFGIYCSFIDLQRNGIPPTGNIASIYSSDNKYAISAGVKELINAGLYNPPKNIFGFIYFILDKHTKRIKIGRSKNIGQRLQAIKYMNSDPDLLKLIRIIGTPLEFYKKLEFKIHKKFKSHRLHGEWFSISKQDITSINQELFDFKITNVPLPKSK